VEDYVTKYSAYVLKVLLSGSMIHLSKLRTLLVLSINQCRTIWVDQMPISLCS